MKWGSNPSLLSSQPKKIPELSPGGLQKKEVSGVRRDA
jgi:hypothetical protein